MGHGTYTTHGRGGGSGPSPAERSDADERLPPGVAWPPRAAEATAVIEALRSEDLAAALDELGRWFERDPGQRGCYAMHRREGRWTVGLEVGDERFTAGRDAELRGAIRNALMIAKFAGHP